MNEIKNYYLSLKAGITNSHYYYILVESEKKIKKIELEFYGFSFGDFEETALLKI